MELVVMPTSELVDMIKEIVSKEFRDMQLQEYQEPKKNESVFDNLLTRKQAAKLLGVSLPTLNEWTKTGKLKGYKLNTRVRYQLKDLNSFLLNPKGVNHKQLVLNEFPSSVCQILETNGQYFIITDTALILNTETAETEEDAWIKAANELELC